MWTAFDSGERRLVRMQILEPKTASVLRTDTVNPEDEAAMAAVLESQVGAIERLVRSEELPLTRDALVDTDHPAWRVLRAVASN